MPKQKGIVGLDELRKKLQNAPEKLRLQELYGALRQEGTQQSVLDRMQTRAELYEVLGYHEYEQKLDELFVREGAVK